ncbi:MAG TPA: BON domain-containing protein [Longimicrobiaceae bacterium]|nr:BON domain-containing protein [Longimicrobiaceae bacterium]
MAQDYQDFDELFFDFENMDDEAVYDVVQQQLREYRGLDAGWIDVAVTDGHVTLSGRVGTDAEKQIAEKIVVDTLGISKFSNELVVAELVRGDVPEAADDAAAYEAELGEPLGGGDGSQSDTASHIPENLDADMYGTHDMQKAIEEGTAYEPPDRPIADGYGSEEQH